MKKILIITAAIVLCGTAVAQVPKEMSSTPLSFMFSKLVQSEAGEVDTPYIIFSVSSQKNNDNLNNVLKNIALAERLEIKVTKVINKNKSPAQLFKVTAKAPVDGTLFCSQVSPKEEIICAKDKSAFPLKGSTKTSRELMIYSWSF